MRVRSSWRRDDSDGGTDGWSSTSIRREEEAPARGGWIGGRRAAHHDEREVEHNGVGGNSRELPRDSGDVAATRLLPIAEVMHRMDGGLDGERREPDDEESGNDAPGPGTGAEYSERRHEQEKPEARGLGIDASGGDQRG